MASVSCFLTFRNSLFSFLFCKERHMIKLVRPGCGHAVQRTAEAKALQSIAGQIAYFQHTAAADFAGCGGAL